MALHCQLVNEAFLIFSIHNLFFLDFIKLEVKIESVQDYRITSNMHA